MPFTYPLQKFLSKVQEEKIKSKEIVHLFLVFGFTDAIS